MTDHTKQQTAYLAGSCFWGMKGLVQAIHGVQTEAWRHTCHYTRRFDLEENKQPKQCRCRLSEAKIFNSTVPRSLSAAARFTGASHSDVPDTQLRYSM